MFPGANSKRIVSYREISPAAELDFEYRQTLCRLQNVVYVHEWCGAKHLTKLMRRPKKHDQMHRRKTILSNEHAPPHPQPQTTPAKLSSRERRRTTVNQVRGGHRARIRASHRATVARNSNRSRSERPPSSLAYGQSSRVGRMVAQSCTSLSVCTQTW